MKKNKLNTIEAYIYAKKLHLLSSSITPQSLEEKNLITNTISVAEKLLDLCKNKILEQKLNNDSFLVLKKELESSNYSFPNNEGLRILKSMLDEYKKYQAFVSPEAELPK